MKYFSNKPIFTEDEMFERLFLERRVLTASDLPIKIILNYWSDSTGECHCFPIFKTDKAMDIINRYADVFPLEYKKLVTEVKDINDTLYNDSGMSQAKINMAKLKIPIIVFRAMEEIDPNFWNGDKGMKWMRANIKPLKIGNTV